MSSPRFWRRGASIILPALLAPAAVLYRLGFLLRQAGAKPHRARVPVICVGAATVGGAGKTPLTFALAQRLRQQGRRVHIVTRGYGGSERGPLRVDPARHLATEVGDETLVLTQSSPVWLARNRAAGVAAAAQDGAEVVLLDDGLQNGTIAKDFSILTVDGISGFGNGWQLPAGPLREPVAKAAARCQLAVIIGPDEAGVAQRLPAGLPLLKARIEPTHPQNVKGRRWFAFCGLGAPEKFRRTIEEMGLDLAGWREFPDHHRYSEKELDRLRADASALNAGLLTTRKDWVRVHPDFRAGLTPLDILLRFEDEAALDQLLKPVLTR
ncbi:tetraacyldisaccharide 4'-kinase [Hypericibacter sp.]|uniref:tetraacyldisaccharide 4'-kinase n=1 Tax=Hypericibacter sp. TaxID=2705401 RepID=UPI003D6C8E5C